MTASRLSRPASPRYFFDPLVLLMIICIGVGFGGFVYWAATAQLAQGITANGVLALKDQRRTMQHLEGGIISDIQIREGQDVAAGDLLLTLTDANAQARLRQVEADMAARAAALDRLEANLADTSDLAFPRLTALGFDHMSLAPLKFAETQVFMDQKAAINGQRRLVLAKIDRLRAERAALVSRSDGKEREL
ncbi:MAG: biotin/lipoyl-binding protein, partial [Pseudomonadota bacterium]